MRVCNLRVCVRVCVCVCLCGCECVLWCAVCVSCRIVLRCIQFLLLTHRGAAARRQRGGERQRGAGEAPDIGGARRRGGREAPEGWGWKPGRRSGAVGGGEGWKPKARGHKKPKAGADASKLKYNTAQRNAAGQGTTQHNKQQSKQDT